MVADGETGSVVKAIWIFVGGPLGAVENNRETSKITVPMIQTVILTVC